MPTLHNPLGWVMNLAQRSQLVDIARQFDLFIIEDAAYAWLIENTPPPLMSLAPERTVYVCGFFQKNIATGLRVGMVVCREALMPAIERTIRATSWNTPALTTALVCGWIRGWDAGPARNHNARRCAAAAGHRPSGAGWLTNDWQ